MNIKYPLEELSPKEVEKLVVLVCERISSVATILKAQCINLRPVNQIGS